MGTSIVITSGKGGTGKTTCAGAIGHALASLGKKVLLIDCDIGLANLDIILGLTDKALWDFSDILSGTAGAERAVIAHPSIENLYFLPAPSVASAQDIAASDFSRLVSSLCEEYDFVILDSPAGVGTGFELACRAADMAVIVTTSDSTSLRDGQRVCVLLHEFGIENVRLIVNRVDPKMMKKIRRNVDDIIDSVGAQLIGIVSEDESIPLAANNEKPLLLFGAKYAYAQFYRIARRLTGEDVPLGKF